MKLAKIHAAIIFSLVTSFLAGPASVMSPPPGSWLHPVDVQASVVKHFDPPAAQWSAGHRGVDFTPGSGTVVAPASGTVHFSGTVVNRKVLSIDHGDGYLSSYEPIESDLKKGDSVAAGQLLGALGDYEDDTQHCPSDCLHFGVRLHGEYINPLPLLGAFRPSVLLPLSQS